MTMFQGGLPLPWRDAGARIDVEALLGRLDAQSAANRAARDLALALRYAATRTRPLSPPLCPTTPAHIRHAQAVLDIAVEWRMPETERWSVAWLMASRLPHLRIRWSSRSRDGRARLEGRASGDVCAMAGCGEGVHLGTTAGELATWTPDSGATKDGAMTEGVWTVAARQGWLFAAGAHAHSWGRAPEGSSPWPELPHTAGVGAAAVTSAGVVVCGDERGAVRMCAPGGTWDELPVRHESRVVAVAADAVRIGVVWRNGRTAILKPVGGVWRLCDDRDLGGTVGCAAWAADGRLAFALDGEAQVRILESAGAVREAWLHPRVARMSWSPDGRLATAGREKHVRVATPVPGAEPDQLGVASEITAMTFASEHCLVTAHGRDLVQWDLRRSGSDDPTLEPDAEITAVGLAPQDRGVSAAGTRLGMLWQYDGAGVASQGIPARTRGTVHQLVRHRDGWLVASQDGAYWWRPREDCLSRLSSRLCLAVATWHGDAAVFAQNTQVVHRGVPDGTPAVLMDFDAPVRDLAVANDFLAALDDSGTAKVLRRDGTRWKRGNAGDRLLACLPGERLLMLHTRDMTVTTLGRSGSQLHSRLHPGATSVAANDRGELVAAYPDKGIAVFAAAEAGPPGTTVVREEAPGQFSVVGATSQRVVAAGRGRVAGYDRSTPRAAAGTGTVELRTAVEQGVCRIRLPGGGDTHIPPAALDSLLRKAGGTAEGTTVQDLTEAVDLGGRIGDRLWSAGLDRAIDEARGELPERPVRVAWLFEDDALAEVPWELLHPSVGPLSWFASPPVTMVRLVTPGGGETAPARSGPCTDRPRMLVARTEDPVLRAVDMAYDRMRRRTRRNRLRLVSSMPEVVGSAGGLDRALRPADIIHLWAHSDADGVTAAPGERPIPVDDVAHRIAATGARLVILVGCRSAALGRELVSRGVDAAVSMRTAVYGHTVQPLVEELTAQALAGLPLDLAFAEALRHYVLTGQPGAPAVPVLHLRADSDGLLFPPTDHH